MIRKFEIQDLQSVMQIWLSANIQAHDFVPEEYWIGNVDLVKEMLPKAELYVYEENGNIKGFVGIDRGYIAGIFVSDAVRSKGIGKQLLEICKEQYSELSLSVYQKNSRATDFYLREGFTVKKETMDETTGEMEYFMTWRNEVVSCSNQI